MSTQPSMFTEDYSAQRVDEWLARFRAAGFPYPDPMPPEERLLEWKRLRAVNFDALIEDQIIKQSMEGNDLAWSYFPHRWGIKCNDMLTPLEVFNDDERMRKVLGKCLTFNDKISGTVLRHWLTKFSGTQVVSNFRPTAAAAIYRYFLRPKQVLGALFGDAAEATGTVWDMSSGFGGRLLGAMASGAVKKYIGTDPSTPTFTGLQQLAADFAKRSGTEVELYKLGSEEFWPSPESLDLCFTSPPYFDTEKYADEDTQSYKKYSSQGAWLNGFMAQTLLNCIQGLKPEGRIAINIAPVKSYPTVCDDLLALAAKLSLQHTHTLQLALRKICGSHNATKKANHENFKYEPVFIFRKKA